MKRPKQIFVAVGAGVLLAGSAAIALAETSGSSSTAAPTATAPTAPATTTAATIHAATATVGGKPEQILVDAKGLPLYTYNLDSPGQSHVTGVLAQLWPPLDSASPTEAGLPGTVSAIPAANGHQVQYNGHFLYTFVNDAPDHVTGQNVQGFFVATPGLNNDTQTTTPVPAATQSNGYGY